ncbi:hypothetical protein TrCOL_g11946 [Triparma columacea]|uniref:Uncharacterized protein n=1 Tax=Triparma columacea TaxID=722753 RepID=A0A9W7GJI7_9STRA|nr:hypothetical protein TrCOL_g11946 [Triparma columacea]
MVAQVLILFLCFAFVACQKGARGYDAYVNEIKNLNSAMEPHKQALSDAREEALEHEKVIKVAKRDMVLNKLEDIKLGPRNAHHRNNEIRKANNQHLSMEGHDGRGVNNKAVSSDSAEKLSDIRQEMQETNQDTEEAINEAVSELQAINQVREEAKESIDNIINQLDQVEIDLARTKKDVKLGGRR